MTFLTTTARALARIVRGLAAAAILAALLIGIPVALVAFIGWPLPDHLPDVAELGDRLNQPYNDTTFLLNALAVALWLAWARFAYGVTVEAVVAIRHGAAYRPSLDWHSAPVRGAAAVLIGAIMGALLFDLARGIVVSDPASAAGPTAAKPAVATALHDTPTVTAQRRANSPQVTQHSAARVNTSAGNADTYRVCRGDTLWDIAADRLGDPHKWRSIWTLNRGTVFPDGRTFTRPDRIHTGWELKLPTIDTPARQEPPQSFLDAHAHDGDEPAPAITASPQLPDDDGVAVAPSGPATHTPAAERTPAASPRDHSTDAATRITLPGGSWISLGLAAALGAAGRLVWIQRRRRYQPKPPTSRLRLADPDAAALPPVVRRIERSLAGTRHPIKPRTDDETPAGSEQMPAIAQVPGDAAPSLWQPGQIVLTGPDTAAVARGTLINALAAGAHDLDDRGHVVIPAATLHSLLPDVAVETLPANPRLVVAGDLRDALDWCEEQLLHRRRVLISHEVDDAVALRDIAPYAEPMQPITLITNAPQAADTIRAAAIFTQGRRVNITATILGAWTGHTLTSDAGVEPDAATLPAAGERPASLSAADTIAMLHTVTESQTGHRATDPDVDRDEDTRAPADEERTSSAGDEPTMDVDGPPTAVCDEDADGLDSVPRDETGAEVAQVPRPVRVRVTVLGGLTIHNPDERTVNPPIRHSSHELLAYLVARGGQVMIETILEDVLPYYKHDKAASNLHTFAYSLRRGLKQIGGKQPYIDNKAHRYVLNRDALDVDLWNLQDAIARATAATNPGDRIAALREAISHYGGPFVGDLAYEWKPRFDYAIHRQVLDARVALAEALQKRDPDEALQVIEDAIAQDPKAEELYRRAMDLHAAAGNIDAIRDLRRAVVRALEEEDLEPSDDLIGHAEQLVSQLARKRARPAPAR